jgi:hypothetical protein
MPHPYVLTDDTLVVFVGNETFTAPRDHGRFDEVLAAVIAEDPVEEFRKILEPTTAIAAAVEAQNLGNVEVTSSSVLYNGAPVADVLVDRILDIVNCDLPLEPWKKFVQNLYANPYLAAREELYLFMEKGKMPLTEDGCFLAYKKVTEDYKDVHSRTFDNSIGQTVSMPREQVDKDRRNTCSTGLHFCSKDYISYFYSNRGHVIIVKINPADVVSIPADYENTKGRTWKYEVVGEIPEEEVAGKVWAPIEFDDDDDDDEDDWEPDPSCSCHACEEYYNREDDDEAFEAGCFEDSCDVF